MWRETVPLPPFLEDDERLLGNGWRNLSHFGLHKLVDDNLGLQLSWLPWAPRRRRVGAEAYSLLRS